MAGPARPTRPARPTARKQLHLVKNREQWERRDGMPFIDQWGRQWWGEIDVDSRDLVCTPVLQSHVTPVPIPDKYIKSRGLGKLHCDVQAWLNDARVSQNEYRQRVITTARQMFGTAYQQKIDQNDPDLYAAVGGGPMPVEFIEAYVAGNKWVRGEPGYPRPKWVTDELWGRYRAFRKTVWLPSDAVEGEAVDPAKYADDDPLEQDDTTETPATEAPTTGGLDRYADLEEQFDPNATGGRRAPVRRRRPEAA